jgi:cell division septal protein FtsQ
MNNKTKDTLTAMIFAFCIIAGAIYWSSIFIPSALREIKIEQDKKMKEDQIVLQGCKNYKYQSTIYNHGTPWRYIYTCEDGKQVATKLLWVK